MSSLHNEAQNRNSAGNQHQSSRVLSPDDGDAFQVEDHLGLNKATGTIPFVMVVFSLFIKGAIFLFINGPMLHSLLHGKKYASILIIFRDGLVQTWATVLTSDVTKNPFTSSSLLLVLSIIIGLLVTPLERIFSSLSIISVNMLSRLTFGSRFFYSSGSTQSSEYTALLSWLMHNPQAKLHWEWELFHFYNYWSVATNLVLFSLLCAFSLPSGVSIQPVLVMAIGFSAFAFFHARTMQNVHDYYIQQWRTASGHTNNTSNVTPVYTSVSNALDTSELIKISHSRIDPFVFQLAQKLYRCLRIPPSFRPEIILFCGHILAICGAIAFWVARNNSSYGLLAAFFVLGYQFTDIIDGVHARATGQCRNSGELLDHFFDPLSFSYLIIGLSLYVDKIALMISGVICMFATATLINIRAQLTRQFIIPKFGATELRLSFVLAGLTISIFSLFVSNFITLVLVEGLSWAIFFIGLVQLVTQLIKSCIKVNNSGIQPNTSPWNIRNTD